MVVACPFARGLKSTDGMGPFVNRAASILFMRRHNSYADAIQFSQLLLGRRASAGRYGFCEFDNPLVLVVPQIQRRNL
jgi:hypothetical protein